MGFSFKRFIASAFMVFCGVRVFDAKPNFFDRENSREFSNDREIKMALVLILIFLSMSDYIIPKCFKEIITTKLKYVILFFTII